MSAVRDVAAAVRGAGRDAGRAAGAATAAWLAGLAAVAIALAAGAAPERLGPWLVLALAAAGLAATAGLGGVPWAAQGAAMGVGGVAAVLLQAHASAPLAVAVAAAGLAGAAATVAVGAAAVRLRPALVAAASWLLAWLVWVAIARLPGLSGAGQGVVVPHPARAATVAVAALVLLGAAALLVAALARGPAGLPLAALRANPRAAAALGIGAVRARLAALALTGACGGLAGALATQDDGVLDATRFDPRVSALLLAAVLIGGPSVTGAALGVCVLAALDALGGAAAAAELSHLGRVDTGSAFHDLVVSGLVLLALALGGGGLWPALARRLPRRARPVAPAPDAAPAGAAAELRAEGLARSFGEVRALEGLDLRLAAGRVVALVGANGSGKTTALAALAGALEPDAGVLRLDGAPLAGGGQAGRVRDGVVRTLQADGALDGLRLRDAVAAGAAPRAVDGGALRTLLATPRSRAARAALAARAEGLLALVGLEGRGADAVDALAADERRRLEIACALATRPRVLLLDEPAAGADAAGVERLAGLVRTLRGRGLAILLVEHRLALVRAVADEVVVLGGGRVVASGSPATVLPTAPAA